MPGLAGQPGLSSSTLGKIPGSWSVRARQAVRNGERSTIYLPSGERYTGGWKGNKREGKGSVVYPNGDRYEGDWQQGRRHGLGTLWSYEGGRYRVRYNGEWASDRFHGMGTFYDDACNVYEGQWQHGMRHGQGQQVFNRSPGDHDGGDEYEGDWEHDNRSGHGRMMFANGDVFEGMWANDSRNGPGVYIYATSRRRYEGFWQEDIAKCGVYSDAAPQAQSQLPELKLQDARNVLAAAQQELPPLVYY